MSELIIILGSPNDAKGNLLPMAIGRLNKGIDVFSQQDGECKILLTGGFGAHFNTTDQPHAYYAKKYLLSRGVDEKYLTEFALSCDTVDDAKKCIPFIERMNPDKTIVISSDFHMDRVKYIFEVTFPSQQLDFFASEYIHSCSEEKKIELEAHERKELESLKTTGRSRLMNVAL